MLSLKSIINFLRFEIDRPTDSDLGRGEGKGGSSLELIPSHAQIRPRMATLFPQRLPRSSSISQNTGILASLFHCL